MSPFIQTSPAREAANEIQSLITEVVGFNTATLRRIYELVNTPGEQQAILDKFGAKGAAALSAYVALQTAMELVAPASVPPADPEVFQAQADGTILYTAPEVPTPINEEA